MVIVGSCDPSFLDDVANDDVMVGIPLQDGDVLVFLVASRAPLL